MSEIKITNFDRITATPEALAEFLGTHFGFPCECCKWWQGEQPCYHDCPYNSDANIEGWESWLKKGDDDE